MSAASQSSFQICDDHQLPFEDNYFSLIIVGSVFTHIGDLEDTWLMELKIVLRKRRGFYVTAHDNHTINMVLSSKPGHWLNGSSIQRELFGFDTKS